MCVFLNTENGCRTCLAMRHLAEHVFVNTACPFSYMLAGCSAFVLRQQAPQMGERCSCLGCPPPAGLARAREAAGVPYYEIPVQANLDITLPSYDQRAKITSASRQCSLSS